MNKVFKLTFFIALGVLIFSSHCYGAWVWTPETGRWFNPKHGVKDTAQDQLEWAVGFYEAKNYKRAISEFNKLLQYYPNAEHASRAQYYVGRCYEDMEEYFHAYLAYQKVIEAYPYAKNREEIIKRQYEIGIMFFEGHKAKVLGLALLPATDKAIEIFEHVIKNSPYGDYADKSQFKIGEAYKKTNRFAEAAIAFQQLVSEYPHSELAEKATYEVAQCGYLASLGYSYDQKTTDDAIEKFEDFVVDARDTGLSKGAEESLQQLKEKKAQSIYDIAIFYEKAHQYQSAAIYYQELVDMYPESELAAESLNKIMKLEKRLARTKKR